MNRFIKRFNRLIKFPINSLRFKEIHWNSILQDDIRVDGIDNIILKEKCIIQRGSWIAAVPLTGASACLEIGNGCVIGNYNHIYAASSIILHDNVLTADKVYISDCSHCYEDIDVPIKDQPIKQLCKVEIGEGSWIGENACVMGASIGKHCIIGANAIVTHDIPDYSVAVGGPARVIKKYDFTLNKWVKC